jgi:hypothetical protein
MIEAYSSLFLGHSSDIVTQCNRRDEHSTKVQPDIPLVCFNILGDVRYEINCICKHCSKLKVAMVQRVRCLK